MSKKESSSRPGANGKDNGISEEILSTLCGLIDSLEYVPIVSNAVYYERLFNREKLLEFIGCRRLAESEVPCSDHKQTPNQSSSKGTLQHEGSNARTRLADPLGCSIEDILSEVWAGEIGFPLPEKHMLPRVALYHRFKHSRLVGDSNQSYLKWLKNLFLNYAEWELSNSKIDDRLRKSRSKTIPDLKEDIENGRDYTLSYIADELDYLTASQPKLDPLAVLARFRLPLYITTSPFDFLEKAMAAEGIEARTQVCFRSNEPGNLDDAHQTIADLDPKPENPVVYHLFGLEDYPKYMVLNEDQYLEFLPEFFRDFKQHMTYLPGYVGIKVTRFSLLLLGYRLRDLEFRVMLKSLIGPMPRFKEKLNLAIQLDPAVQCPEVDAESVKLYLEDAESVKDYLNDYFVVHDFNVLWDTTDVFMAKLFKEWQKWEQRKG